MWSLNVAIFPEARSTGERNYQTMKASRWKLPEPLPAEISLMYLSKSTWWKALCSSECLLRCITKDMWIWHRLVVEFCHHVYCIYVSSFDVKQLSFLWNLTAVSNLALMSKEDLPTRLLTIRLMQQYRCMCVCVCVCVCKCETCCACVHVCACTQCPFERQAQVFRPSIAN